MNCDVHFAVLGAVHACHACVLLVHLRTVNTTTRRGYKAPAHHISELKVDKNVHIIVANTCVINTKPYKNME